MSAYRLQRLKLVGGCGIPYGPSVLHVVEKHPGGGKLGREKTCFSDLDLIAQPDVVVIVDCGDEQGGEVGLGLGEEPEGGAGLESPDRC